MTALHTLGSVQLNLPQVDFNQVVETAPRMINGNSMHRRSIEFQSKEAEYVNKRVKQCGLGGRPFRFSFFPNLVDVIPASLHVTVIFFCVVLIFFSSVATGFFMYNAFGSPYETLHGPLGLYLWNFVCCLCSCLVMILFASEVKLHRLSDHIANFNESTFVYKTLTEQFDHSFWLIFLTFLVHGLNILLIRVAGIQFPFQEAKESDVNTGASDLMY
uniref:clarin-1 isoform X2 n=1 Tax=Oncorhynchus gorbuscha TaxID=8017 RepID=UPI001EAED17C|nr:clarin-1 isoform X2 [Oncorhynchus gorbuscha]